MSEPITQGIFFEVINQLREDMLASHTRLRADMTDGFKELSRRWDGHCRNETALETRVTIIETEHKIEREQALKHGTWAGLVTASALTGLIELAKRIFR